MKAFSRRALGELGFLQGAVRKLAQDRNLALRLLAASRNATHASAQHEFWLEFSWVDQEYRAAVRRLAQFCADHAALPALASRSSR
jgi:hypothetical protein